MKYFFNFIQSSVDETRILRRMNSDIEAELKRDRKKPGQEIKLLILGTEQSGKSTFVKQMRIIHGNSYHERERCSFIPHIHSYTLLAANALIDTMKKLAISFKYNDNVKNSELISSKDTSICCHLSEQLVGAINCLWRDGNVQSVYLRRGECHFDSAKYFLDSLDRISSPGYIPSDEDILRVRIPTTGVEESFFELKSFTFRIMDVGGLRSERKKWIHCFDSVSSIIFLASLNDYDQLLDCSEAESASGSSSDRSTKMEESLALFSTIVSYAGFSRTSFMLFLNKVDLFEQKITNSNLSSYYPEYTGPKLDATSAGKFIENLYVARSRKCARIMSFTNNKFEAVPSVDRIENNTPLYERWRPSRHWPLKNAHSGDTDNARFTSSPYSANSDQKNFQIGWKNIYTHFTTATDTENIRLVFSSIKDNISRQNMDESLF